ncbi:MAG: hypothetical protein UW01_C0015G0001 [Candidatus Nomurabacteria bacterium GW2011_GWA2_43_66]|uniref:YdbS-like PH domain-containing protein n=1 Tax=Candidatus Nomurabacteria bacterium GW2011_GWF2_43_24 TaxID=1618778 RepID=A0A0G1EJV2_9BACT|nr:MAG: hypothetical protein UV13_C0015G0001 [Parcubacteria group bacterium GW2011_GWC1_42_21]KKS57203.1 MAG: hypothetical protein UV23_C0031G0001 [Candidatus Nomurabacteria bacterium GW2011_GWF1_42_40]KKS99232.1 MAG: hypothetical protein UV77_C0016G0001 [Candidatus Nomurabacteria bacterium GW2011_GWA1_43_17]KKT10275.1 MAG: hypothetical protein UV91_C0015G0001 [Candidatus Nomurabacteria bacterium GW2011_GWF2_43_24]KKT17525.1 MAG: hypothetical protein UW01_C0015G0001 [Candidatus Nomurabacteria b
MLKLDDNEKLIIVFRKHIFHFLTQLFGIILVALFPFVAYLLLGSLISFSPSSQSVYSFLFFYFILLVILWNIGFMLWTDYYLDMWILTDKRLIDVEQKGLFSREVSSLRLDRIQDIKSEVLGLVHTFMGMGSVHVQTAGSEKEFVIHNIKKPEQVKEFILSAYNKQMEETKTAQAENETVIDHV